jgi:hypothetical protein
MTNIFKKLRKIESNKQYSEEEINQLILEININDIKTINAIKNGALLSAWK